MLLCCIPHGGGGGFCHTSPVCWHQVEQAANIDHFGWFSHVEWWSQALPSSWEAPNIMASYASEQGPAPCRNVLATLTQVLSLKWWPSIHHTFACAHRLAVATTIRVARRLCLRSACHEERRRRAARGGKNTQTIVCVATRVRSSDITTETQPLPILPEDMWFAILAFTQRDWWPAHKECADCIMYRKSTVQPTSDDEMKTLTFQNQVLPKPM
jgi:hypothetical protein